MSATNPNQSLLQEFPPISRDRWRAQAEAELKGASIDKKLVRPTPEGIAVQPIYTAEDLPESLAADQIPGFPPFRRGARPADADGPAWRISQEIPNGLPRDFNRAARADLAAGATSINLHLDAATRAAKDPDQARPDQVGAGGVSIATLEDVAGALEDIDFRNHPMFIRTGASVLAFSALLFAWMKKTDRKLTDLTGCIETDPLGVLLHEGVLPSTLENAYREMAEVTKWAIEHAPHLQTICVHARAIHESGGNAVQELAFALAAGAEYLRAMIAAGLDVDVVAPRMRFTFCIGSDFFMEIAKLRAARLLWAAAVAGFDGNAASQRMTLHGQTAKWNKSRLDPHVNLLRTTSECLAGALAGCDSLTVSPFDELARTPDDFSRRLAKNIQLILQEESGIGEVVDPVGGAYYAEALTDSLARSAWQQFGEIEQGGGLGAALRRGTVQKAVAQVASARLEDLARRKSVLIGTNLHANPAETPLTSKTSGTESLHAKRSRQVAAYRTGGEAGEDTAILDRLQALLTSEPNTALDAAIEAALAGATLGEIARSLSWREECRTESVPLCVHRGAQAFERLRAAAEDLAQRTGKPPQVFLANMGPVKQHKLRADFSAGFFAVGGFQVLASAPLPDADAAAQAALDSGAQVVVICSTDDTYPDLAPKIAAAIKAAKPETLLVLAGRPGDTEAAFRNAGIDHFIYLGANAVVLLQTFLLRSGAEL